MASMLKKDYASWKSREIDNLTALLERYRVLAIADLYKVRTFQLQQLMKSFGSNVHMHVAKKTLAIKALDRCQKPSIKNLSEHLVGSKIFLFTDVNPFKLYFLLNKNKIRITAKAGDHAQEDVIIPSGNTGLPPGPVISELSEIGLRTKIEAGSVWVIQDTVVVKKGDSFTAKTASVLSKLGVKPLEVGLNLIAAYDEGLILTEDELHIDLYETNRHLSEACSQAFNLAVNVAYPTLETIKPILQKAKLSAISLAMKSLYPTHETIPQILGIAYAQMLSLTSRLAEINREVAPKTG